MALQLLGDQMVLGDGELFVLGVGCQLNDLHTVKKRTGNGIQRVGGGDEKAVRKIEGKLHEVVAEALVLLAVQHLQKRRGRVAVGVTGHLVDLVQKDQGIAYLRLNEGVDDPSGHGADVGLSVSADVRLIAYTAQGNANVAALHGTGNGGAHRGLTHTGRAYKTEDLIAQGRIELLDGKVFKDAILYLLQAVMIGVKDPLGGGNVDPIFGLLCPRDLKTGVKIRASHSCLGGAEGRFRHAVILLQKLFAYLLGHLGFHDLIVVFVGFVGVTQLLLDHMDLLPQIKLLLIAVQIGANALVNIHLTLKKGGLLLKKGNQGLNALDGIEALQHRLLVLVLDQNVCGDEVGKKGGVLDGSCHHQNVVAEGGKQRNQILGVGQHGAAECLGADRILVGHGQSLADHICRYVIGEQREFGCCCAGISLHDQTHTALGGLDRLLDAANGSHLVEEVGGEGLSRRIAQGADQHGRVGLKGGFRRTDIDLLGHLKVEGDAGEGNGTAKSDDGKSLFIYFFYVFRHFQGSFRGLRINISIQLYIIT